MHILICNDDGIFAPGIRALYQAVRTLPDTQVTVIAPDRNQSTIGHRKTLREPLRITEVELEDDLKGFACSGSPADSIALALMGFVQEPVDLVLSGINQGGNMGQDLTYSGTVTAAMEAALYGVPAVAFSLDNHDDPAFEHAAAFARYIAPIVAQHGLPEFTLLNVNVPYGGRPEGVKITRQGRRVYHDRLVQRIDPSGRPYYWIGGERPTGDTKTEGTDLWAIAEGYISVTPVRLDMTAHDITPKLEEWELHLPT